MMFRRSSRLRGDWKRVLAEAWMVETERRTGFLA
jgi:hypothetical protein